MKNFSHVRVGLLGGAMRYYVTMRKLLGSICLLQRSLTAHPPRRIGSTCIPACHRHSRSGTPSG